VHSRAEIRKLANRFIPASLLWRLGLKTELVFWDRYFATGGLDWSPRYAERLDPDAPLLESAVIESLDRLDQRELSVLDVGAGPITALGRVYRGRRLRIVAVDALADEYAAMLCRHGVLSPVPTIYGKGENLLDRFRPDSFDLAYARNALDHCVDPVRTIVNMVSLVRPDRDVVLVHGVDEAETSAYAGLHQWNFREYEGALLVWNQGEVHNLTNVVAGAARVRCDEQHGELVVVITKLSSGLATPSGEPT
jgi:SAM-dependent methyltransferase